MLQTIMSIGRILVEEALYGWYTEHKIKEEWCDYAIAARKK